MMSRNRAARIQSSTSVAAAGEPVARAVDAARSAALYIVAVVLILAAASGLMAITLAGR
jgi:hypothetical protein